MTPEGIPGSPHGHRDRSTRLAVIGVFLIVLGCCSILLGAFSTLTLMLVPQTAGAPGYGPAQAIPGLLVYLGGGVMLITLGVGSFRARRWARPLVLVVGWAWLAVGTFAGVVAAFMVPGVLESMPQADPATPWVAFGCLGIVFGLFGVLAPAVLLLLYRGSDVAATLVHRDPEPRWTDRIPTPLLGLCLWLGVSAGGSALSSLYGVLPLGATILTGAPAVAIYLALAALFAYLAIGLARRSRTAWWIAVGTVVVVGGWVLLVIPRTDMAEVLALMGTPQQPGMPDLSGLYQAPWFVAAMGAGWAALLTYVLFARRYLR